MMLCISCSFKRTSLHHRSLPPIPAHAPPPVAAHTLTHLRSTLCNDSRRSHNDVMMHPSDVIDHTGHATYGIDNFITNLNSTEEMVRFV